MFSKAVLSIFGRTPDELMNNLADADKTQIPILEIRLDLLRELPLPLAIMDKIRHSTTKQLIFTLRKTSEGGGCALSDEERLPFYQKALDLEFEFIDIEFSSEKLFEKILALDCQEKIILSQHNFQETNSKNIFRLYSVMCEKTVFIIKIVTMAQCRKDNIVLQNLLVKHNAKSPLLTCFCMGPKGRVSRLFGYYHGNALTYFSFQDAFRTAPGQLTYQEYLELQL